MRYKKPDLKDNKAVYKGKRYWVVELSGKEEVDGFGADFCDYIMYDKLFEATLATIKKEPNGKLVASLMSHVDLSYEFDDMRDLIVSVPAYADAYYKDCS